MEYIFFCSNCKRAYVDYDSDLDVYCNECHHILVNSNITTDQWRLLSKSDRRFLWEDVISSWNKQQILKRQAEIEEQRKQQEFKELERKRKTEEEQEKDGLESFGRGFSVKETDTGLDPLFVEAGRRIIEKQIASIGLIQRILKIGFNRASRIMDQLTDAGVVGPEVGTRLSSILMTIEEFEQFVAENNIWKYMDRESKEENNFQLLSGSNVTTSDKEVCESIAINHGLELNWENDMDSLYRDKSTLYKICEFDDSYDFIINMAVNYNPEQLRFILVGNYSEYNKLPHLIMPVVKAEKELVACQWAVNEILRRKQCFLDANVRDIRSYNRLAVEKSAIKKLPIIYIVIEELSNYSISSEMKEVIMRILVDGQRTGIILAMFSQMSMKNLGLGAAFDILKVEDSKNCPYVGHGKIETDGTNYDDNDITIEYVDNNMDGREFELYSGELLEKNGFTDVAVTKSSGDYGVDITAYKDGVKFAIQCKKYSGKVGIEAVQEVIGSKSIYDCHVGVVLTNSYFTTSAMELAKKNMILLWDRNKLIQLMECNK